MRIAFLNPQGNFDPSDRGWTEHPDFGGQLVYVKEVALAMGARGHHVDIITRQMNDANWPEFESPTDSHPGHDNVRILRFPCGPPDFVHKEGLWPYLSDWVDRIVEFYRVEGTTPEAATGHYGDGGLAAVLLEERLGSPFTFTAHSLGAQKFDKMLQEVGDVPALLERFRFDKRLAAERLAMARAGVVITSSQQERFQQYGHSAYGGAIQPDDDRKFAVIPPGVNLQIFGAEVRNEVEEATREKVEAMLNRDIAQARRSLPVVICSSRLEPKKNHLAIVRAWALDAELRAAANLAIIVRGSPDPLRQRAAAFSGEALDILDQMAEVLDSADLWSSVSAFDLNSQLELAAAYRHLATSYRGVFALPTLYEPFGLAPLEAMAAGLPAAATCNGGHSESLHEGTQEFGVLFDPQGPADIARGLKRLVCDPGNWEAMHRSGRERVESRFTWERTAEGYLAVLEAITAGHASPIPDYPKATYFEDPLMDDLTIDWLGSVYPLPGV